MTKRQEQLLMIYLANVLTHTVIMWNASRRIINENLFVQYIGDNHVSLSQEVSD